MENDKLLKEDYELEYAKAKGTLVEVRQGGLKIYSAGKITGFSADHVAIEGKKVLRSVNDFYVSE
jgi:hypothetical protein